LSLVVPHVHLEAILPRCIEVGVFAPLLILFFLLFLLFFRLFMIAPTIFVFIVRLVFITIMTTAPTAGRVFTNFARGGTNGIVK
jgi:hypothetical protein